jgi:hypothetical protein
MFALSRTVEWVCVTVMALWLLGSVLYALPWVGLRRRLERNNAGRWFANWTVFGTGRRRAEIERFRLRFRDRAAGHPGEWQLAMRGRRWVWHGCLWHPERRVADRLHRIGRDLAHALDQPDGERRSAALASALIARHLDVIRPRAPGVSREVQLVEEHAVCDARADAARPDVITERVILELALPPA